MSSYYNEHDPKAAAWLRELIAAGLIPDGHVDERSIVEVQPHELKLYTQCHFFAGIAGWPLALQLAGWPATRPIWTASLPCQPFSAAGRGEGACDDRHLWPVFARLVRECRPGVVIGEQVAAAIGFNWLDGISADLEGMQYAVWPAVLGAHSVGAPHRRQRLYWLAYSQHAERRPEHQEHGNAHGRNGLRRGGSTGGLVLPDGTGREPGGQAAATMGYRGAVESAGNAGRVGETEQPGPQGRSIGRNGGSECADRAASVGDASSPLGDATGGGRGVSGDAPLSGRGGYPERADRAGFSGMAAAERTRKRGRTERGLGTGGREVGEQENRPCAANQPRHRRDTVDPWGDYTIVPCRDGKGRRIESGTAPLVNGLPRGVVPSGDPSIAEAQATGEARVMRLRGYGNAINCPLAAEFIAAFMDLEK